jgi:hypothetical protein
MKKGSRESHHYCARKGQTVLDSSPHKRQQGGYSPNCQPNARRRVQLRRPHLSRETLAVIPPRYFLQGAPLSNIFYIVSYFLGIVKRKS